MKKNSFLFISVGVALLSLTVYANKKKDDMQRIVDKLQFRLSGIKNINLSFKYIALNLDIQAVNPTSEHLHINTGFITAKVLRVYQKETKKLLAFTNLNTHKIHIASGGFYQLPPINIKIPLITGGQMVLNQFIKNNKNDIHKQFAEQLVFELDIEAVGFKKTIQF